MKKTILTVSAISLILAGCGAGGGEGQSKVVGGNVNTNLSTSSESTTPPVSPVSTDGQVVVSTVKTSDREFAMLYNVNSTLAGNLVGKRSLMTRAASSIYEGTLKVIDQNGEEQLFDWPSYIDEDNHVAIAQKTLVLKKGTYEIHLLLEKGDRQFAGKQTATIDDSSQLELSFDLHALLGDVIMNVDEVENLSKFVVSFESSEVSSFSEPKLGASINGGEEVFLDINKATGELEGLLNLNVGDSVRFTFNDGTVQEGKTGTFIIAEGTEEYEVDFTPLYGEVTFDTNSADGNTSFRLNFSESVIEDMGTDFETVLKYMNNDNYGEQIVFLTQNGDNTYSAVVPLGDVTYGTFDYTLSFIDKDSSTEFAKCVAEIPDLTSLDVANSCKVVIQNDTFINNNLLGVFGVNINDSMGIGKEGYSIFVDNEFVGYTGTGIFGTKGYLKSYVGSGEHVLKAEKNGETYLKNIVVDPLSVNNYSFLTDSNETDPASGQLDANITAQSFSVAQGSKDGGTITLSNAGDSEVTYNIVVEEGTATQQRKLSSNSLVLTNTTILKSVDYSNKTVSFEYFSESGDLISTKTIKENELPKRVIVKYKDSAQRSNGSNLEIKEVDNSTLENFMEEFNSLENSDEVEYIEPDTKLNLFNLAQPEDELFFYQWGLHNDGTLFGIEDSDADWLEFFNEYTPSDKEVIVAVIDTGLDYTHPDINDNVWVNSGEVPNNGIDDDGNGYVDDIYGYDFLNNDSDPMDDNGHGTHVSGIIAAEKNTIGVVGVNPYNVKIMALKFLGADGYGYTSDAIRAIQYSLDNGAHITNNSWGCTGEGCYSKSLEDAIRLTVDKEQIFVAAAGNDAADIDSVPSYPANYDIPTVISVGNSDASDLLSTWSNYGLENVDILAPGTDIASLWPNNSYVLATGTSMSAPFVTGMVSVLYNKGEGNTPFQGIMENIFASGDATETAKVNSKYGTRVNVYNSYTTYLPSNEWFSVVENKTGTLQPGEVVSVPFSVDMTYQKGNASKSKRVVIENSANEITYDVTVDVTK